MEQGVAGRGVQPAWLQARIKPVSSAKVSLRLNKATSASLLIHFCRVRNVESLPPCAAPASGRGTNPAWRYSAAINFRWNPTNLKAR